MFVERVFSLTKRLPNRLRSGHNVKHDKVGIEYFGHVETSVRIGIESEPGHGSEFYFVLPGV